MSNWEVTTIEEAKEATLALMKAAHVANAYLSQGDVRQAAEALRGEYSSIELADELERLEEEA